MNFLAHCALADEASSLWGVASEQNKGLLAGAIIADFTKGRINPTWPRSLQAGIRLHRRIDAVSNQHADIRKSCERFAKPLRRFAPIFIDILADHYLSLNWHKYSAENLDAFASRCYQAIGGYADYMPSERRTFLNYMSETNLLGRYHEWPTIERALLFSLKRLGRDELSEDVLVAAQALTETAAEDFPNYYNDFRNQLSDWSGLLGTK